MVFVEYRRAPQHRYPAAVEDCYVAILWTAKHAAELGIDPGRLGVQGESACGGLAEARACATSSRPRPNWTTA